MPQDNLSDTTDAAPVEQPCRVCREPILFAASKCTKCGSYQDWTRHLLRWSTLTVALLALLPLWGIFQSLHQIAFAIDSPRIQAAITACNRDVVTVAYINNGTRHGIITAHTIQLTRGDEPVTGLSVRPSTPAGSLVVTPGQPPVLVDFRAFIGGQPTAFLPAKHGYRDCTIRLDARWADFSGQSQALERRCSCPA